MLDGGLRSTPVELRKSKSCTVQERKTPMLTPSQGGQFHLLPESNSPVLAVQSEQCTTRTLSQIMQEDPHSGLPIPTSHVDFSVEKRKDPKLLALIQYLTKGTVPEDQHQSTLMVAKAAFFSIIDDVLYHLDAK